MNTAVIRRHAVAVLRKRLARGWSRTSIEATTYEGSSNSEARPGYLMSAGKLSFPSVLRHDDADHTFKLRDLLDEIEKRPTQRSLFA